MNFKKKNIIWLSVLLFTVIVAGTAFAETVSDSVDPKQSLTAMEIILKGGWTMIPLAILSVLAVALAFHIFLLLDPKSIIPQDLISSITEHIKNKRFDDAKNYAQRQNNAAGRIFAAGLSVRGFGEKKVEEFLVNTGKRELGSYRRRISVLGYIGNLAPMFGLLGTVVGMIQAFRVVALSSDPMVQAEKGYLLSSAIWKAMITTAAGLIIGIFALMLYYYFSGRLDRVASELEEETEKFALAIGNTSDSESYTENEE